MARVRSKCQVTFIECESQRVSRGADTDRKREGVSLSNICVIGTGYVGLVTGACLADLGNDVTCVDIDEAKVARLNAGQIPIYEPGLEEVVGRNVRAGRLHFTSSYASAVPPAQFIYIAVNTPAGQAGEADMSQAR